MLICQESYTSVKRVNQKIKRNYRSVERDLKNSKESLKRAPPAPTLDRALKCFTN